MEEQCRTEAEKASAMLRMTTAAVVAQLGASSDTGKRLLQLEAECMELELLAKKRN
jgi:hypothetical protein